jgi:hypothetical protein
MVFLPYDMQQELDAEIARQQQDDELYNQAFNQPSQQGAPSRGGMGRQQQQDPLQSMDYGAGTDAMLANLQANNEISQAKDQGGGWQNQLGKMGGQLLNKGMGGKGGVVQGIMGEMPKGMMGKLGEWSGVTGKWATNPSTGKAVELTPNPQMAQAGMGGPSWWQQPGAQARGAFDQGMTFAKQVPKELGKYGNMLPDLAQGGFSMAGQGLGSMASGLGSGLGAAGSAIGSGLGAAGSAGAAGASAGAAAIAELAPMLLALL